MIVILTGVSGSGKTTLGLRLAGDLGWRFLDADDFQTARDPKAASAAQPPSGNGLEPSLAALRAEVAVMVARGEDAVLACSALKSAERSALAVDPRAVRFVYLKGGAGLLRRRLRNRSGHFLTADSLAGQFAKVEEPEDAVTIDIDERPGRIVEQIREALRI